MSVTNYKEKQSQLDAVKYLKTIEDRDKIFKEIKGLTNSQNDELMNVEEIIKKRRNIYNDLVILDEQVTERKKNVDNLEEVKNKYDTIKEAKLFELKNENREKIKDIELRKRKYQLIKYQNFLNEEAIHLLWLLFAILVVSSLLVLGYLIKLPGFIKTAIFAAIFSALGLYGVYLFKKLLVDNVNIDIYNIDMYHYEKPSSEELTKDKNMKDKLLALRGNSTDDNCLKQEYDYQTLEDIKQDSLEKVQNEMNKNQGGTAEQCLKLTKS